MTIPFVYRWQELSTNKWYIGSRYKKGCHPDDGYLCSSKIVKTLIEANPDNWQRTIIEICSTPQEARQKEAALLQSVDAKRDPMSYNQTNADGKFGWSGPHSAETREKMRKNHLDYTGDKNPMYGKVGGMKGKTHTQSTKAKIAQSQRGKAISFETRKKIKDALNGLVWIHNGLESRRIDLTAESIPDGWVLGLLPDHAEKLRLAKLGDKHWNFGKTQPDETKQKISESLKGKKNPPDVCLKKKLGNAKRPKLMCEGCGQQYLHCHKRHHLKCSPI